MPSLLRHCFILPVVLLLVAVVAAALELEKSKSDKDAASITVPTGETPKLDGVINDGEWKNAVTRPLVNGGEVRFRCADDRLFVAVRGPAAGWAHIGILGDARVRILHASNALGDVAYDVATDKTWSLKGSFNWQLSGRIDPRRLPRLLAHYLKKNGWTATNNNAGQPTDIEFEIDLAAMSRPNTLRLVVVYSTNDTAAPLSIWPTTVADDSINRDLVNGSPPKSATFHPEQWGLLMLPGERTDNPATSRPARP